MRVSCRLLRARPVRATQNLRWSPFRLTSISSPRADEMQWAGRAASACRRRASLEANCQNAGADQPDTREVLPRVTPSGTRYRLNRTNKIPLLAIEWNLMGSGTGNLMGGVWATAPSGELDSSRCGSYPERLTLLGVALPLTFCVIYVLPRQRHTWENPGPQSHGSENPSRSPGCRGRVGQLSPRID